MIIFLITLTIFSAANFAMMDRFDIVACLLIVLNALCIFMLEVEKNIRFGPMKKRNSGYDIDHVTEAYDDGYVQSMLQFMTQFIEEYKQEISKFGSSSPSVVDMVTSLLDRANRLKGISRLGKFHCNQEENNFVFHFQYRYENE